MEQQLLNQFHFYFSDSNLVKDKFLKGQLAESKEGWLPLELFLSFNKIKKLTTNIEDLKNALSKSTILELNENKSMVRREKCFIEKEIPSNHVIYVENLSIHWDQDKVREIFQNFGNVTHVRLPKDKQTHEFRGFGFIEFSSPDEAFNALNLNGYQDPSWIQPIVVLSKDEWMHRKRLYTTDHKQTKAIVHKQIPHLLLSNLMPAMPLKAIRNFLNMFGSVGYIELCSPNSCITQFTSEICTERCIYYLEHYKQFMMADAPVSVRKLSEEEYKQTTTNSKRKRTFAGEESRTKRLK